MTSENEERQRCMEHFSEVVKNRYKGKNLIDIPETDEDIDVFEGKAITRKIKRWEPSGYYGITAEMILAENEATTWLLTRLFYKMWHEEAKPDNWRLGVLVKRAKIRDLAGCNNYQYITLTSVVMKLYSRLLLKSLERKIYEKMNEHLLRHVVLQYVEHRNPLLMAFVDYEKAFDSVNRSIMWRVLVIVEFVMCKVNVSEFYHMNFQ
ncbi:uncharacterized protein [Palaemon carinicauda]|uniref:uncharacterized protein n=1 Tax=Palaemon carinicauda TaxID=392227 RepID=UPI0035B66DB6